MLFRKILLSGFLLITFCQRMHAGFFLNDAACQETIRKDIPCKNPLLPFSSPPYLIAVSDLIPDMEQNESPVGAPPYYLNPETANKLARAKEILAKDGIKLTLLSGYLPYPGPLTFDEAFASCMTDIEYEKTGRALHRGALVDVTISYLSGQPMGLPSFPFSPINTPASPTCNACHNIYLLHKAMQRSGFEPAGTKWWRFEDKNWRLYPLLNIPL